MPKKKVKKSHKKAHRLVVKVRFNKECSPGEAKRLFADYVHGTFYCSDGREECPDTFVIGKTTIAKEPAKTWSTSSRTPCL